MLLSIPSSTVAAISLGYYYIIRLFHCYLLYLYAPLSSSNLLNLWSIPNTSTSFIQYLLYQPWHLTLLVLKLLKSNSLISTIPCTPEPDTFLCSHLSECRGSFYSMLFLSCQLPTCSMVHLFITDKLYSNPLLLSRYPVQTLLLFIGFITVCQYLITICILAA